MILNTPSPRLQNVTPPLIETQGLSRSYRVGSTDISALHDVSLHIQRGEIVALTGSSGSGKSTLLQLIGGLDKANEGSIRIAGKNITNLRGLQLARYRRLTVGFVFQSFYLQPFLSVRRNIEVSLMFAGIPRDKRAAVIDEVLKAVGLEDRADHLPKELSGGQMQRVAIARAIVNRPQILLADEPTGNLDSANSERIMQLFTDIRNRYGTTIIIVTHDPLLAAQADRSITLKDGGIVQ